MDIIVRTTPVRNARRRPLVAFAVRDIAADFLAKPRSRGFPVALNRLRRNAFRIGRLLRGQAAEEALLEDPCGARIRAFEACKGIIESEGFTDRTVGQEGLDIFDRDMIGASSPFLPLTGPRIVDEHAPHRVRGRREEFRAIGGSKAMLGEQTKVRLVHQPRGSERMPGSLAKEPLPGHAPQVVVEQGNQAVERVGLATPQGLEAKRDLSRRQWIRMSRILIVRRHSR